MRWAWRSSSSPCWGADDDLPADEVAELEITDALELGGEPRADDRVRAEAWPLILEALGAVAP